jgi:PHS family inorganic phosphate transporter-like MFS transporter
VWRIVIGLSLIPAFATLYQRLTLPEATRFLVSQKSLADQEAFVDPKNADEKDGTKGGSMGLRTATGLASLNLGRPEEIVKRKAHFSGKSAYHSLWHRS